MDAAVGLHGALPSVSTPSFDKIMSTPGVLIEIFKFSQDNGAFGHQSPQPLRLVELTLSQISSECRNTVLSFPLLWRRIVVTPRQSICMLALYLQRSQACPLDVLVSLLDCGGDHVQDNIANMFTMLIAHSARWRNLYLNTRCVLFGSIVLQKMQYLSLPALERLSLCIGSQACRARLSTEPTYPLIVGQAAPSLTSLRLRGLALHFAQPHLATVTTLHIDQTEYFPIAPTAFFQLLNTPTSLRHLSLFGDVVRDGLTPGLFQTIPLPFLESLRMCSITGLSDATFLLTISAPALKSLVFQDVIFHDLDPFLLQATSSTFPNLHSLSFYNFDLTDLTYFKLFDIFPSLKTFTCLCPARLPSILKHLSSPKIVPWRVLESVTILFNEQVRPWIGRAIQHRYNSGHPLKTVRLKGTAGDIQNAFDWNPSQFNVNLQIFQTLNPWPPGRHSPDPVDTLFLVAEESETNL